MKVLKKISFWIAIFLIILVMNIAGLFVGNPIGYLLAWNTTIGLLRREYPDEDYQIKSMGYEIKHGDYVVEVASPSKVDEYFTLWIKDFGTEIRHYSRPDFHINTMIRLGDEYRDFIEEKGFWESLEFETKYDFQFRNKYANVINYPAAYSGIYVPHKDALALEELELNKTYDIEEFALAHGEISIGANVEEPTFEMIANILLEAKQVADEKDVPFSTLSVYLYKKDVYSSDPVVQVVYFRYEDIYETDLVERVEENFENYKKAKEEASLGKPI